MPKNDNNDNLDNAEATQTPAEYTPEAVAEETEETVTPITEARSKRRLGTGAIIGSLQRCSQLVFEVALLSPT
jgi:hypothetical protein